MIQNDHWLPACAPSGAALAAPFCIINKMFANMCEYFKLLIIQFYGFQQPIFALKLANDTVQDAVDEEVVLLARILLGYLYILVERDLQGYLRIVHYLRE